MYKRKIHLFALALLFPIIVQAQEYQPSWKSLDTKPVPEWYQDAKFGIFIHWGVYSVPAFSKVGGYAEWYQHKLRSDSTNPTIKFQKEVYGNQSYYDLAKYFKAELFDPEAWAKLFDKAGAKYVALTSKHHDGFCLWPSKVGDRDWGFPWNATEVGPHKDLIKSLFKALRKTDVKPGLYYSLYEWYNPLYLKNVDSFVAKHTIPQMKDLINTYHPYVLFTDGGWDHSAKTWHAQQFLAWLYNDSPMKDSIVTYDRWGGGVRFHHGMVYTPEYQPGLTFDGHYFEESQGMGFSYGYNRAEDITDYSSGRLLTLQLIDIVSRGGNFLLDIGPRADGKIPAIMQERLLHIGQWLSVNGEAIYGTRPWKNAVQWSDGNRKYEPEEDETLLLKQTINPESGYAVKEIFFTHKPDTLYCILPQYPQEELVVKNIQLPANAQVTLLATGQKLSWENKETGVRIEVPAFNPNKISISDAYVVRIVNDPNYVKKPKIQSDYKRFTAVPEVTIFSVSPNATIYYTTDGSVPDKQSKLYKAPFKLTETTTIRAIAFKDGWVSSKIDSLVVKKHKWHAAVKVKQPQSGLIYRYYESDKPSLEEHGMVVSEGVTSKINLNKKEKASNFAFQFQGYIQIPKSGVYTFYLTSDDGSALSIDGNRVIDNDGPHGALQKTAKLALKKGFHKMEVRYFDAGGNNTLELKVKVDGDEKKDLSSDWLYH